MPGLRWLSRRLVPALSSAAEVEARLADARVDSTRCLIATGQWPHRFGDAWAERIGAFAVGDRRLRLVFDGWLTRPAVEELRSRLPAAASGGWDVMFADGWQYAWGGSPYRLWSRRRGVVARVDGPGRLAVPGRRSLAAPRAVAEVRAEIVAEGARHVLTVAWSDGDVTTLASHREWAARLDPTYDGLELLADASWLATLGAELAAALAVPLRTHHAALARTTREPT